MFMALFVGLGLVLTVVAFSHRENVFFAPMLHGAALLVWLIATWLLVMYALDAYPGTYIPTATGFFGMTMVLISTIAILLPYLRSRKKMPEDQQYNQRQGEYKRKIASMSQKKEKMWWQYLLRGD